MNKSFLKNQKESFNRQKEDAAAEEALEELIPTKSQISVTEVLRIQEREMVRLLINYGWQQIGEEGMHLCQYLLSETQELQFETPVYSKILVLYRQELEKGNLPGPDHFLSSRDSEVQKEVIDLVTQRYEVSTHWHEKHQITIPTETDDLTQTGYKTILRLKKKMVLRLMDEAKSKIKNAELEKLSDDKVHEVQVIYVELRKVLLEIDKELGIVIG